MNLLSFVYFELCFHVSGVLCPVKKSQNPRGIGYTDLILRWMEFCKHSFLFTSISAITKFESLLLLKISLPHGNNFGRIRIRKGIRFRLIIAASHMMDVVVRILVFFFKNYFLNDIGSPRVYNGDGTLTHDNKVDVIITKVETLNLKPFLHGNMSILKRSAFKVKM